MHESLHNNGYISASQNFACMASNLTALQFYIQLW